MGINVGGVVGSNVGLHDGENEGLKLGAHEGSKDGEKEVMEIMKIICLKYVMIERFRESWSNAISVA